MNWWKRKRIEQQISQLVPRLYSITYSWGCPKDVSDDLVQEAVTTALDKCAQLRDVNTLHCWVIRILVNTHRQYLRKHRWLMTIEDSDLIEEIGPARILEASRNVDKVRAAIALLSDEHRKVLVLVDMEGLSYRDVADVLEIKLGTVMSRLGRARLKLKKILSDSDYASNKTGDNKAEYKPEHANLQRVK